MNIIKSKNDKKEYENYILDNKLDVFIIKDHTSNICAASMVVGIGTIDDTIEGVAHFLEHMLFLGCKDYPEEHGFMDFISKCGGETNAFTADNRTNYYFSSESTFFLEGLNMFSGFFIQPLLLENAVEREMNAVHSEYTKNIQDDMWRLEDIKKKLCTKNHPLSRFSIGNLKTLNKPNIHKKIKEFYEKKYSSHLMNLIVYINDNIDINKLKQQINNTFIKIKCNDNNPQRSFGNIINKKKILRYVPNSDITLIVVQFEVPSFVKTPKSCPYNFISYVLGHEGENSLHSILSDKGWISSIYTGIDITLDDYCVFEIKIKLSDEGFKNKIDIIDIVFSYINNFKLNIKEKIIEDLYEETIKISKISFNNWEENDPISTIISIGELLINKNIKQNEVIALQTLRVDYKNLINNLTKALENFTKNNCSILLGNRIYSNTLDSIEEHYNIEYNISDDKIFDCPIKHNINVLPNINKYITENIKNIKDNDTTEPIIIKNDKIIGIYNYNSSYNSPTTEIRVKIELPTIYDSIEQYVRTLILLNTIYNDNNKFIYAAMIANYNIIFSIDYKSLIIIITGYTAKIDIIMQEVIKIITHLKFRKISFLSAKDQLRKQYINFTFLNPYIKLDSYIKKGLLDNFYLPSECLKEIESVTEDNCKEAFLKTLEISNITVFVSGNITKISALKIINNFNDIYDKFIKIIYDPPINSRNDVKNITSKNAIIYKNTNINDKNSAIRYLIKLCEFRVGYTKNWDLHIANINIITLLFSSKYFDQLRTKEQLGYVVGCGLSIIGDQYYKNVFLEFVIQSPIKDSKYLIERTNKFIVDYCKSIDTITTEEFESYKLGALVNFTKPFYNLTELNDYYWQQISDKTYIYSKRDMVANIIKNLTKDKLSIILDEYICGNNKVFACGIDN